MRYKLAALAVVLSVLSLPGSRAEAQSTYGAVVGTALDPSSAVLPGATVTLTEVQTNFDRTTTTDSVGSFEFQNLTQGLYAVKVELAGFKTFKTEPFRVEARETVRIDAKVAVGGLSEQVVVRSAAPVINTETPTVAGKVSNRELQELPFTFRTSNTSPIPAIQAIPEVQKVGDQYSLSGALPYQTEVSVDGILTTSVRRNGIGAEGVNVFPSMESIQEIKVSSISNTAEFPQLGDITTVSRPGTNALHGTAFYNFNSTGLNANPNYFTIAAPNQSDNTNVGLSVGGPVVRGKTFFFGAFERLDIERTQSAAATVPSAAFRQGDFSSLSTAIVDPSTGQPFAGNRIPSSRINPVATRLMDTYMPAPNDGTSLNRYTIDGTETSNQFDVRIDQNFSAGHTLFGRVSWKDVERLSPTTYQSLGPRTDVKPNQTVAVSHNLAINSNLLNEARFGYTRADQSFTTGPARSRRHQRSRADAPVDQPAGRDRVPLGADCRLHDPLARARKSR